MGSFLGSLPLLVAKVDLAIACSDHQLNRHWLLRTEGKVKWVVPKIICFEHLIVQCILVFLIDVLAARDVDLGSVTNFLCNFAVMIRDRREIISVLLLADKARHQGRPPLI